MPELSYGSHIFQDLVEAGILYTAIFGNETTMIWNSGMLNRFSDKKEDFCRADPVIFDVMALYDAKKAQMKVYHDITKKEVICLSE